ncbi:hypothetical protein [Cellulosimicrobium sp. NPDC057127]|uniref:hypothetical protein n=1 Tax=Cellulosimicrobium sp. NPDC057127 TaxID=3346026 RepID=UPI00362FA8FB
MSESSQQNDGYDPSQDPDADPANLNPREGAEAQGSGTSNDADPDADPANLNPRTGGEASDEGSGA